MVRDWLVLKMSPKRRFSRLMKLFGHGNFWCMTYLDELHNMKTEGTIVKEFEDAGAVVQVTLRVVPSRVNTFVPLRVLTGPFMPTILDPIALTNMQGIVTSNHDSSSDIFLAEMATHRLVNENKTQDPQVLEVEVYHSRNLMMSAVHLYAESASSGRCLVALAHTLDANTLPSPATLKCKTPNNMVNNVAMCDINAGERAMIIKTANGDWALLVAYWEGLKRGTPGSLSKRGVPGCPGHLVVRIHCPPAAPARIITLPYDQQVYTHNIQDLYIDMQDGLFKVSGNTKNWVENVALGLSVTVLHILCQPRHMPDTVDGLSNKYIDPLMLPRRIPVENLKLIAALGFFCAAAPTNAFHRSNDPHGTSTVCTLGVVTTNIGGGCGSCGGCGGCGGGYYATFGEASCGGWGGGGEGGGVGVSGGGVGDGDGGMDPFVCMLASVAGVDGGGEQRKTELVIEIFHVSAELLIND
ncbi:uncharacterized protein LOC121873356 [Homarus americanus]|uniref:uncharacterized protein LOC121873356 n=1 Tax=Homarus americanus TaxID=6706 RepID=UPI001C46FD0B|nr:uncharacterized protein LOC121873356 [Homarus americanus]